MPATLSDVPPEVANDLKVIGELAYNGLFKNIRDVQIVFSDSEVREGLHLGLLSEAREMYVSEGVVLSYSFLHLSIQEFLAAWHISCHPDLQESAICALSNFMNSHQEPYYMTACACFLAGLLRKNPFPIGSN